MRRAAVVALAVLAAGAARGQEPWLPLAEGRRWTYTETVVIHGAEAGAAQVGTATLTCGALDRGAHHVVWRLQDGQQRVAWYRPDAGGVTVTRSEGDGVLLPFRSADAGTVERVTTALGAHDAFRVDRESSAPGPRTRRTSVWYARGVGPVKVVQVIEAPGSRLERELVLREVTPGAPSVEAPARGLAAALDAAKADRSERALAALAAELLGRAERARGAAPPGRAAGRVAAPAWTWATEDADLRRHVVPRFEAQKNLLRAVVVADEGAEVQGNVAESVIFARAGVALRGNALRSLVVCLGDVEVGGNVLDCVIVAGKDLRVSGNVQGTVVQGATFEGAGHRLGLTVVPAGEDDLLTPLGP